jgi:PilZ domain
MDWRGPAPRETTDWPGRYWFEDDPQVHEGDCRVVDISVEGAGVEVFGDTPIEPVGHRLSVRVQGPRGLTIVIHLAGVVRNLSLGSSGGVRLGVQFFGVTAMERGILQALESLQAAP